jgi:leucyl aminopeptidase
MDIRVEVGAIQALAADLIVVNLFQGVDKPGGATGAVDAALGGAITALIASGDFRGKSGETAVLYTRGAIPAARVLLAGLGEQEKFSADVARSVAGEVARSVRELGVRRYASVVHGAGAGGLGPAVAAQALVEGTVLGSYRFQVHKTETASKVADLEGLTVVAFDEAQAAAISAGAEAGRIVAEAVCLPATWPTSRQFPDADHIGRKGRGSGQRLRPADRGAGRERDGRPFYGGAVGRGPGLRRAGPVHHPAAQRRAH